MTDTDAVIAERERWMRELWAIPTSDAACLPGEFTIMEFAGVNHIGRASARSKLDILEKMGRVRVRKVTHGSTIRCFYSRVE